MPLGNRLTAVGDTVTETGWAAVMVTLALALFDASSTLVALTTKLPAVDAAV